MFLFCFTFMRKDDSFHVIIQFHGFAGRLFLKVSEAMLGLLCPSSMKDKRLCHTTLGRQCLQDYTTITLSSLFTIPLTLRVGLW